MRKVSRGGKKDMEWEEGREKQSSKLTEKSESWYQLISQVYLK